jgi:hypothetical protein
MTLGKDELDKRPLLQADDCSLIRGLSSSKRFATEQQKHLLFGLSSRIVARTYRATTRRWSIEGNHHHCPLIDLAGKCIGDGTPIALPYSETTDRSGSLRLSTPDRRHISDIDQILALILGVEKI